ncbi:uroporphyrinogen decarboxylase family protein [Parasphaerochaeta coccoides]|uniref:Uroporphyrinogen decarboxylase (URO-D) domain-containing protein n=1 Tax=Parasphaerochaeta coccoides (strain ATCC BAA-1237 / DSM 17374 / SPN1) TaxID=760011 RepID=F4GHI6_PARC1|nr:uroporphyrinogen decarboxylase family protein [Parasphaerochaeta coccoides]AEC02575.1 hypothetical protein Spico_1370 [Parasphaerochaeta coccoides DSM 17374]
MNPRMRFDQFLKGEPYTEGMPAAFFQHFPVDARHGDIAFDVQMAYWKQTGMDMMKIMFDDIYPKLPDVRSCSDWNDIPVFPMSHPVFTQQAELAGRLVDAVGKETYVFQTIFSPFVSAGCSISPIPVWDKDVTAHFNDDPKSVIKGLTRIVTVLLEFAQMMVRTGIDGFYVSLQGGEQWRFPLDFFREYFRPVELAFLQGLKDTGKIVFLHICGTDIRLDEYLEYPGDVVNYSIRGNSMSPAEAVNSFKCPIMGGMPNKGLFGNSTRKEIEQIVSHTLYENPGITMLGADCTVPADISWEELKWAVDVAHGYERRKK